MITSEQIQGFDNIYNTYHQAVFGNILRIVDDHATAEDLLQEVFIAYWENRYLVDTGNVGNWLFVVSYNKSLKYLKSKHRLHVPVTGIENNLTAYHPEQDEPVEQIFMQQFRILEEAVASLPHRKQQVFRLCRVQGLSPDEAAEQLKISATSVRDYLKQSTRQIRDYITKHSPEYGLATFPILYHFLS